MAAKKAERAAKNGDATKEADPASADKKAAFVTAATKGNSSKDVDTTEKKESIKEKMAAKKAQWAAKRAAAG